MAPVPTSPNGPASPLAPHQRWDQKPDIHQVVLGDIFFDTWYPSFYPDELVGKELDRLYVCPHCFKYTKEQPQYLAHLNSCLYKSDGPPGQLIYTQGNHGIYEIDGEEHQLFAQNLSLFAKLFLDNKSVFFDVGSFNYYLFVHFPPPNSSLASPQVIGFFSKEKVSWDNNNLACILVFPPWQRKGLGKVLMSISYDLSKKEGRYGGPEKPLSELGRKGYMQYWDARVARTILDWKGKKSMTVNEIAKEAWVLTDDVIASLKRMGVLGMKRKDESVGVSKIAIREWAQKNDVDLTPLVCDEGFRGEWASQNGHSTP